MTTIKLKNGSGAPTAGDLVQGEPALDLTNKRLYTEDSGGTVIEVGTNPTSITTGDITATGTATFANLATSGDVTFGDNDKAIFGAGSDLQIYHDGTDSYVDDQGTGRLRLRGASQIILEHPTNGETYAAFQANGASTIYYDNTARLATTSTGIDVTGSVTADGITSSADILVQESIPQLILDDTDVTDASGTLVQAGSTLFLRSRGGTSSYGAIRFARNNGSDTNALDIASNGDISFYNDAGTSQDLFWDASASRLGLGTTSPSYLVDAQSSGDAAIRIRSTGTGASDDSLLRMQIAGTTASNIIAFGDADSSFAGEIRYTHSNNSMIFDTNGAERMRIDSAGNVGIGTSSPAQKLTVSESSAGFAVLIKNSLTSGNGLRIQAGDNSGDRILQLDDKDGNEKLRVTALGDVGIGTTDLTDSYKTIIEGSDQETANLTDAGTHGATLFLRATGEGVGSGGAVAFGTTFGNKRPFAAIKGYVSDGTANSLGDLVFSTRATTSATALTERMRLTQSGRLVVGVNTAQGKLDVQSDGQYTPAAYFRNDGNAIGWARADWYNNQASGTGIIYRDQAGSFVFRNDNSSGTAMTTRIVAGGTTAGNIVFNKDATGTGEVGRFDASGNLFIGKTSASFGTEGIAFNTPNEMTITRDSGTCVFLRRNTADGEVQTFYKDTSKVGSISVTSSATAYNTSSDRRLKDNIVDAPSASDDIDAIQVRSFDWKADGSHQKYGMVAQELQSVAPDAVSEGDTEEDMMGVDYSKLVPMLVKEIQSLRARVAQLEND